ncbi:thioredoxin [Perkinsela sp. CCAP 1560/4]|nr:thioredoxin [Perkinsela sp. CCAP 1560/4]|eukprot:KNH04989.1 thioredoxin [Perkinsela sp. CCAP 1560/4]
MFLQLVAVFLSVHTASAFSFDSDFKIHQPTNLADMRAQINQSRRPVVVFLYAPWCGHCVSFRREFEIFARRVVEIADVYAVDAHSHSQFASFYGLKGFPTIISYHSDKRRNWQHYSGQRTASALTEYVSHQISSTAKLLSDEFDMRQQLEIFPGGVFLFTEKKRIPTLYNLVASDPEFRDTLPFFVVQKEFRGLFAVLEKAFPDTYPRVSILTKSLEAADRIDEQDVYSGNFTYVEMRNFARKALRLVDNKEGNTLPELSEKNIQALCKKRLCVCFNKEHFSNQDKAELMERFQSDPITFLQMDGRKALEGDISEIIQSKKYPILLILKQRSGVISYHLAEADSTSLSILNSAISTIEKLLDGSIRLEHKVGEKSNSQ